MIDGTIKIRCRIPIADANIISGGFTSLVVKSAPPKNNTNEQR